MISLHDSVAKLHLVNQDCAIALKRLNIITVEDLLYCFPRDWQDLSEIKPIAEIKPGEKVNIRAKLKSIKHHRSPRRRMHISTGLLEDLTGNIVAVWFNQPFLKNSLNTGKNYYFSGKAQIYADKKGGQTLQLQSPTFELVKEETIHTAGIIPVYELTEGLTQKQLRDFLKQGLAALPEIADFLPQTLRKSLNLADLQSAIRNIHFPSDKDSLESARRRLAFDELFLFQLAFLSYKRKLKILPAPRFVFNTSLVKKFVESLPFKLTGSQRIAAWEILKDLAENHPMNRLLEGEVGSGKTVVAGIAMLEVAKAGFQSVLLAPTEILAWQHYQTLKELFKNTGLDIALLTRSHKIQPPTSNFQLPIIIGTHALLQERVKFSRIGLLVVDEQHRFGVKQRAQLTRGQKLVPHLLSMTATPIPRSLALAFYGDLDISQLRELPKGRKKIITRLVEPQKRKIAYEFIKKEIQKGRQAYVVTALIGEEDSPPPNLPHQGGGKGANSPPLMGGDRGGGEGEIKAAITESEKLKKIFPEFVIGLLHGRLPGGEKKKIMEEFSAKGGSASGGKSSRIDILVSTTVIEVGVDVPNATIMVIENAERFGLAQLHQLRGRVGRSDLQSFCLLFAENASEITKNRLEAVVKSNDGFELAEIDLDIRGPGEVLGQRQSGYIPFKIAKLSDRAMIKLAKSTAEKILDQDPNLAGAPLLKQKIESLSRDIHLE